MTRRAGKQATTLIRETVRPDELPWPTLNCFQTSHLSRQSMQDLLDHWSPTSVVRLCESREWTSGRWLPVETLEDLRPYRYVRMVGKAYTSVIVIESDTQGTFEALKDFPIPPSYVGLRTSWAQPWKRGRWYGVWLLEEAVTSPGSFAYLRRVRPAMIEALGADAEFREATLARSPFYAGADADYSWAHLHSHKVTLTDLRLAVEDHQRDFGAPVPTRGDVSGRYPEMLPSFRPESSSPARGDQRTGQLWQWDDSGRKILRDPSLFRAAQRWAFPIARDGGTVQEAPLLAHLLELNRELEADLDGTGRGPLDRRQVQKIARSVARFCARTRITGPKGGEGSRWTPEQRRRGGLARSKQESAQDVPPREDGTPGIPAPDARVMGGEQSGKVRREIQAERWHKVEDHLERGLSITEIAEIEGCSERTIRRDVQAVRQADRGQPTDLPTSCPSTDEQDQEPVEGPESISSERPGDDEDVRENALDPVRVSEEPVWSAEKPPDEDDLPDVDQ